MEEFFNYLDHLPPGSFERTLFTLLEQPAALLTVAALIEMLLPLPGSWRLGRLAPIFTAMASKVNLPENTPNQTYLAGMLLPLLVVVLLLTLMLGLSLLAGFDNYLALVLLPLLLEARLSLRLTTPAMRALDEGHKEEARRLLKHAVLRETARLSPMGMCKAATELCLQRTFACWFAVMVWYLLAGLSGALMMQLTAVLARTFSDKDPRYKLFSTALTRAYHVLLLPPALFLGLTMMFSFVPSMHIRRGLQAARAYPAAAAGFVLGVMGSCLNLSLGGPRYYAGTLIRYERIGGLHAPDSSSPLKAFRRIRLCGLILMCAWLIITAFTLPAATLPLPQGGIQTV